MTGGSENFVTRWGLFFEENEEVGTAFFEPESLPLEQFREGAREFLITVFSTLEDEFEESQALDVPAEADALHQAYLASVEAIVSSAPELLAQIDTATADDLGGLFESDFGQALDALFEACAGLQSLAFPEGIDVELICSG
ncbi:MAG: hypothetical protein V3V82_04410 [Acidimicrobiia bacterium]